jgi:antagonist of KipI
LDIIESLEIISPGPLTTVQDLGRYGFGRYGVPPSGALDSFSLRVANLLVGNPETEAGLEITLMGLKLRILTDLVVALCGGDLQPHLNEKPFDMWCSQIVRKGDTLLLKAPRKGCRAYLAVGGGISLVPVLASKSTNLASKFGGYEGRAFRKGDVLFSEAPDRHWRSAGKMFHPEWRPSYTGDWILRVLPGPQDQDFPEESKRLFLDSSFTVSSQSDRTGIRLSGPALHRKKDLGDSIVSEGIVPGAIQVPGDAHPIILLVETVTGGYRKIATVISADLPLLGQVKPGDRVRFCAVSMEEAISALAQQEQAIKTAVSLVQHS